MEHGPDGRSSPTFLKQNFNGQEAADLYQAVHLHTLEDLAEQGPYPKVISQFALRIITYEYPLEAILAIYFLSVTGHLPDKFPHDQWIEAVRWHGDTKIAAIIHTEAEWADAKIILATLENVVVEAESQHGVVVWSSAQNRPPTIPTDSYPLQLIVLPGEEIQRHLPETLHVEATGLGGRDLSYPIPWDISIRSDKEGQSVYGPSLAPMEETVAIPGPSGGSQTLQVTALGRSKAAHEFLVLRYFGVDSAMHWDVLTSEVLPAVQLPGASARRATALEMFGASHIAPSHRRMPHVLWTDSMTLIWNLLMGGRMGRYTGSPDTLVFDQRIDLRGFSAGSFAGLSTLHLLWKIPNVVKACSFKMGLQKSFWVTGFWPLNDSTVSHLQSKHHERKHHERVVVLQSKHHDRKHHERVVVLQSKHHERKHHKRVGVCRLCEPRKKDIMDRIVSRLMFFPTCQGKIYWIISYCFHCFFHVLLSCVFQPLLVHAIIVIPLQPFPMLCC